MRLAENLPEFLARLIFRKPLASQDRSGEVISQSRTIWFEIIDTASLESRSVAVPVHPGEERWRVGTLHSGAELQIAEPKLDRIDLFIVGASNHLLLTGTVVDRVSLPALGVGQREATGEWHWNDPMRLDLTLQNNRLYIRFDYKWLRIGGHALRASWKPIGGAGPPT